MRLAFSADHDCTPAEPDHGLRDCRMPALDAESSFVPVDQAITVRRVIDRQRAVHRAVLARIEALGGSFGRNDDDATGLISLSASASAG